MAGDISFNLLNCPKELSSYRGWKEDVYRDLLAFRHGELTARALRDKYTRRCAILSMDMTGFTATAIRIGELESLVRILDAQRICIPVMRAYEAELIRCFADNWRQRIRRNAVLVSVMVMFWLSALIMRKVTK
jgi:hypothetical protein